MELEDENNFFNISSETTKHQGKVKQSIGKKGKKNISKGKKGKKGKDDGQGKGGKGQETSNVATSTNQSVTSSNAAVPKPTTVQTTWDWQEQWSETDWNDNTWWSSFITFHEEVPKQGNFASYNSAPVPDCLQRSRISEESPSLMSIMEVGFTPLSFNW